MAMTGKKHSTRGTAGQALDEELIDACPHILFAVDRELRLTALNRACVKQMQELYGIQPAVGAAVLACVTAAEDRAALQANLARAFAGEAPQVWLRLGGADTERPTFAVTHSPLRGADGTVGRVQVYAERIGEANLAGMPAGDSAELFENAFEQGVVGAAQVSPDGVYLRANPALCALLGYSEAELVNRSFSEITHDADRELSEGFWRAVQAGQTDTARFEKRYIRKDGVVLWADVSIKAIRGAAGDLRYFLAHFIDITRVKQAQAELQEQQTRLDERVREQTLQIRGSEALYRGLFENMGAVVVLFDGQTGAILDANPAACAFFERPRAALLGARQAELFAAPGLAAERLAQPALAGEKLYFEADYCRKDGAVRSLGIYPEMIGPEGPAGQTVLMVAHDITAKKQVEQSLFESERRFHSVMDHMQEGVVLIGSDWRYLYLNPTAEAQGLRRKEELLGRTVMECWPGIETDPYFVLEKQVMETRVPAEVEGLFPLADGREHWLQWRIQPSAEGLLVIKVDINERKLQEAATADSEERFRLLFNTATDGIMLSSPERFVASANPAACAILGWPPAEIENADISQLLDTSDPRLQALWAERNRTGACRGELTMLRKDGVKIPAEIASTLFTDRQGQTRTSLFFRDIGERVRAEAERQRSHQQLEALAAQVPGGLFQFQRGTDGTYTILFSSAGIREIFSMLTGGSRADLEKLGERIAPDDLARMGAALDESVRGMRPFSAEFRVRALAGPAEGAPERWMWASARPEAQPDGSVLWSGITTDITERKRLEEQVRSSEVKWRSLFEILPVGVALVDENGRVTDTNRALAQILDLAEADMLTAAYTRRKYLRPDLTEMPAEEFASNRALREQTTVRNVETGVVKEDGAVVWTSVSATPLEGGKVTAAVTVDITGRKEEQQRVSEALFFSQTIIETSPIGILIYDDAGDCVAANRAAGEMVDFAPGSLRKQNYHKLESWRNSGLYEAAGQALRSMQPVTVQTHLQAAAGRELWLDCTFTTFINRGRTNLLVMLLDNSERNRAELTLKVTNEKLLAMVDDLGRSNRNADLLRQMSEMLQVCAVMEEAYAVIAQFAPQIFLDGPGALYVFGKNPEQLESVCAWGVSLASDLRFPEEQCWAMRRGQMYTAAAGTRAVRCRHVSPDFEGTYLDIPLTTSGETLGLLHLEWAQAAEPERAAREMAQLFADNISLSFSNIQLRETLHDQSVRDPLTRAYNRRYMEESLERELTRMRRKNGHAGLIMLDIDHFKDFNDTFGHAAGDQLLKQLTDLLQRHVRGADVVCRMGGEEFLMILPETDGEVTLQRAEVVRAAVQILNRDQDSKMMGPITVSVGVAAFPEDGATREELLEKADQAMYRAKRNGRNRVEGSTSLV
jgi:diguanylate cyclase (GGDEF)-like protein/PAS domain S-box-containing protein